MLIIINSNNNNNVNYFYKHIIICIDSITKSSQKDALRAISLMLVRLRMVKLGICFAGWVLNIAPCTSRTGVVYSDFLKFVSVVQVQRTCRQDVNVRESSSIHFVGFCVWYENVKYWFSVR